MARCTCEAVDMFDVGMKVLPRRARRLVLVVLLLLPGGAFVNWYVEEKTAGYEELLDDLLYDLVQHISPPSPDRSIPEGPTAV